MLGNFVGEFKECVTDSNSNLIVSFLVQGSEKARARQSIDNICKVGLKSIASRNLAISIDTHHEKRTTNANSYFWKLCNELAIVLKSTKIEVYQKYIMEQGIFKEIEINADAADTFATAWKMHGEGWLIEKVDRSEHEGFEIINAYYGSSTYNKKQMSRLTYSVVEDCKELGIETRTPDEIENMLNLMEGK